MRFAMLVNPISGKRHGVRIAVQAESVLRSAGHDVAVIPSGDPQLARSRLRIELRQGVDAVLVVGGDGALHNVLSILVEHQATVGLIPAGTGNDTARMLGIPTHDTRAALNIALTGHSRKLDLADVDGRLVITVVAQGFDSKVNERANTMTWPRGSMRYNLAILAELRVFEPLPFTLILDGRTLEREAMLVAIGNGPSFGGGLRICEGASPDDGLLDVAIINPVGKAKLLRVFPKLYQGTHTSLNEFEVHRVRTVTLDSPGVISYGDGERLGPLPMTTSVRAGALRVLCPKRT